MTVPIIIPVMPIAAPMTRSLAVSFLVVNCRLLILEMRLPYFITNIDLCRLAICKINNTFTTIIAIAVDLPNFLNLAMYEYSHSIRDSDIFVDVIN